MSDATTHLLLPYILAAQAQKHVTHNEALRILDGLVQLSVLDRDLTGPPGSPADGDRYIVGSGATGDWAGWDLNVALCTDGAWLRLPPRPGWRVWVEDEGLLLVYDGAGWIGTTPTALQNLALLGLLRAGSDMTFAFVAKHRHIWPVSWMCEVLGVSRSGFHAWLTRPISARASYDAKLVVEIDKSFRASDRTYGARRVWRDVLEDGLACGLHRIERLMRQNALRARPKRRGKPKDEGERSVIADNILDRDFQADRPNQKWLADFTYIWTAEGWLYVSVVLDLFSRRVVGWSMKADRDASLVMDALMMAVWRRGKADALLHHSDQGSQYTSEQFQRLLLDNGITCSMSRAGNVWDNSAMESFFSSLKTERTARRVYRTHDTARADVFDYIERFYNTRRRHSKLGYLSPMAFEDRAMQT